MVMFREDDERIRAEQRAKRSRNPFWRAFRILVWLGCFSGISLAVLSALGGAHEPLRKGLEDFLHESTGKQASIGTLVNMSFFPVLEVDAKGIVLRDAPQQERDASPPAGQPVAEIGALHMSMPFFSALFSRNTFETLEITDARMAAGVFTPRVLSLDTLSIRDGALTGEGSYDGKPLRFSLEMQRIEKAGGRILYRLAREGSASILAGGLKAEGKVTKGTGGLHLVLDALAIGGRSAEVKGDIAFSRGFRTLGIEGALSYGRSRVVFDLAKKGSALTGDVGFSPFDVKDYAALKELYDTLDLVFSGGAGISFTPGRSAMIGLSIHSLENGGAKLGRFETPVLLSGGVLKAQPFSGAFAGGTIDGALILDGGKKPAALELKLSVDDLDYGALQKSLHGLENVTGRANIEIALKGKGAGMDDILRDLSGDMTAIAAEGKMKSAAMLNLWGTGLLNVMLPRLSPGDETLLNCMIADFNVEKGIARAEILFLDTERVTVRGEGEINIPDVTIDMKLKPEPKEAALIDVSTAIRVRGGLGDPGVAPDNLSLLEKIGEIALGTVNPVFWAYSLTDLGLTEDHPCRKYIGNKAP